MGKKKAKNDRAPGEELKKTEREPKAQKNYSFASSHPQHQAEDGLIKVQLPASKEARMVEVIQENYHQTRMDGQASFRVTTKKLTDFYESLSRVGFKHSQIEDAMTNTVQYGGDLMDALDWLCLNLNNDQLPERFSAAMQEQQFKRRPKFDDTLAGQQAAVSVPDTRHVTETAKQLPQQKQKTLPQNVKPPPTTKADEKESVKDWILRYTDQESEEEEEEEEGEGMGALGLHDPNERYLVLTAKLLDAKSAAAEAKQNGDRAAQKEATTKIRTYSQEMSQLECLPTFNPAIKIVDLDEDNPASQKSAKVEKSGREVKNGADHDVCGETGNEGNMAGFAMFEEQTAAKPEKPKSAPKASMPVDKRSFEYTKKQWTGKSPKQFLIDWVRKHEPKSPPPSYNKARAPSNLWRSSVNVVRKERGVLQVTPTIVTENKMDSEHLASTLALYHLCKGQRVYQLLPPPYRDVWLEWQDAEDKVKEEFKAEENKPRDECISNLMKAIKLEDSKQIQSKTETKKTKVTEEEVLQDELKEEGSWEDLASDEDWDASPQASPKPSPKNQYGGRSKIPVFNVAEARERFSKRQKTAKYKTLLATRQQLPVYHHRADILWQVQRENVVVIAGETGSGKSTQIPQFILEEFLSGSGGQACNIVVTEPRRISAQSLATRVSQELGEGKPGSHGTFCGYQIRFEAARTDTTRLLYCTTGVLLRKLQLDPWLKDVTHVVIDEVHERSVQSDFLLIIVKRILEKRLDFKVILMSATIDSDKFSSYFQHCPVYHIPGRTFPVEVYHLEDVVEKTGYTLEEDSVYCLHPGQLVQEQHTKVGVTGARGNVTKTDLTWSKEDLATLDLSGLSPTDYTKHTRNVITRMNQKRINTELIMDLLKFLDTDEEFQEIEGAVLVFLPGLAHIQELYELLLSDRHFADKKRYRLVALHSVLSSEDQSSAFDIPPPGVRKVVIATNIAETGITIPDVVYVIDCGKVKEIRYMETSQMSSLEEVFVSKASARQRQGRAGRVQEGICFRLYTQVKFDSLRQYSVPEILRVPLEELCLHIMKSELGNPIDFLGQAIDAPPTLSVTRAMSILREVGACDPMTPKLTALGHHLAALPVNVRIGKMLVFGAIFGCLEPVAIIAASMSDKSPFASPMGKRDQADAARQSLALNNSDHLTLYKAFTQWKSAQTKGRQAEIELCNRLFLKRNVLLDIDNVVKDLIRLIYSIGFGAPINSPSAATTPLIPVSLSPKQVATVKAVLTAGLYSHVAKVTHTPKVDSAATQAREVCHAQTQQGPATCHPSSINRFLGATGWVVFQEKVRHTQIYLKDTTLISPYSLLLFGGAISVQHREQVVAVDEWIKFKAFARTGVIFKELRILIDDLLERKVANPSLNVNDDPIVMTLLDLIMSER